MQPDLVELSWYLWQSWICEKRDVIVVHVHLVCAVDFEDRQLFVVPVYVCIGYGLQDGETSRIDFHAQISVDDR